MQMAGKRDGTPLLDEKVAPEPLEDGEIDNDTPASPEHIPSRWGGGDNVGPRFPPAPLAAAAIPPFVDLSVPPPNLRGVRPPVAAAGGRPPFAGPPPGFPVGVPPVAVRPTSINPSLMPRPVGARPALLGAPPPMVPPPSMNDEYAARPRHSDKYRSRSPELDRDRWEVFYDYLLPYLFLFLLTSFVLKCINQFFSKYFFVVTKVNRFIF